MDVATVTALVSAAAIASGGVWALVSARRVTRGRVATSDAAVLWQQSQAMVTMLVAQRDRAEAQRDLLIEAHATKVLPALETVSAGLDRLVTGVADCGAVLARLEAGRPGGGGTGDG